MANKVIKIDVDVGEYTSVYRVFDSLGNDLVFEDTMDNDGDYSVEIDGYVIDKEDYDLLQTIKLIDKG